MRGWPPLDLPLGPTRLGWAAHVALWLAAAASVAAWVLAVNELPGGRLPWAAAGALGLALVRPRRPAAVRRLRWDGREWSLALGDGPAQPGTLAVALDLGGWLLLRLEAPQAPRRRWLAVDRRSAGTAWHALRCAVYSARPAPGGPSAAVPPAPDE